LAGFVFKHIRSIARRFGYDLVPRAANTVPPETEPADDALVEFVRGYTMTSPRRIAALANAVRYIVAHDIPGDIVECGVWRGGSMMAVGKLLCDLGATDRDLHLFDTYQGMPAPTDADVDHAGQRADDDFRKLRDGDDHADWCRAPIEIVREAMAASGYPARRIHYIPGKVQDTLPEHAPGTIALARLDTDFYESTAAEMQHLYPRLVPGGVLISDDYFFWQGVRRAIDGYIAEHNLPLLLNRIDHSACIAVKPHT
jgi:hypothetical protein